MEEIGRDDRAVVTMNGEIECDGGEVHNKECS